MAGAGEAPALTPELVELIAEQLHEGHAVTKETWQRAWRNVRALLGVSTEWWTGTNQWLLRHVDFMRSCTIMSDLPERPAHPHTRSAQHALGVARELLSLNPYDPTARCLLRYTPSHPEHASVAALVRNYAEEARAAHGVAEP